MKQVILVRKDLKMPSGKMSAQVAHASVEATFKSDKKYLDEWLEEGMKKVVLKVEDEKELLKYFKLAKQNKLVAVLIKDAGKTFFKNPTNTCVAIGPDDEGKIDKVTGKLKIL
ncbi:MAG: peptidyl-tRNA hydrolase Pth2 [Candidatus Woesearchaeota archaeon]|nr:peptidyl-tRNA hydrolase Pth2 [Candidatus Woesearchaeota archaeon]